MSGLGSIKMIKDELEAAQDEMLPFFIEKYRNDERKGVQAWVRQAQRRLRALKEEEQRIERMKEYEKRYAEYHHICGIDEAGRGPLAGPVVAAAVILPKDCHLLFINDSKKIGAKKRDELYEIIKKEALYVAVGMVSAQRIDEINILQATYEAMRAAVTNLGITPDILLNDAVTIPGIRIKQIPIIKGDEKSISIAAASIIAKVTRDRLMIQYGDLLPAYGFASHKGYGTKAHMDALRSHGISPIHRKSFIGNV